jgi:hypothetical protein
MAAKKQAPARRPVHSVRIGPIEAAVWQNEKKDGGAPFYSVTFKRNYKDGEDWKESSSYGERDCLSLARAALDAQAFIAQQMREAAASERAA